MDSKQFLAEFGHIANAPGGMQRLREMVLSLAVLGKLVNQNVGETIREEVIRYLSNNIDNGAFEVPENWRIAKFKDLLDFQGGGQPPKNTFSTTPKEDYVQLIQIRDLGDNPQPVYIPKELAPKLCTEKDILVGRYGASVGKVFWGKKGAYNVALVKMENLHSAFLPRYLYTLLKSPVGQNLFVGIARSAQSGFNKKDIADKYIPLPPLEEQARIIAKVDELMTLCDKLEEQQHKKRQLQNQLRQATLQAVAASTSPFELKQHWERLQDNFEQLFSAPEDVKELRDLVLDLAIKGALNRTTTTSSSDLLEEISSKKTLLLSKGLYKKAPKLERHEYETDDSFVIPNNWVWTRLIDVGEINPRNIAEDSRQVLFGPMRCFSEEFGEIYGFETAIWADVKKGFTHFANGDVVLAKITPCFENGKSAVIRNLEGTMRIGAGTTELQVFRPIHDGLLSDFVYIYLRSSLFRQEGIKRMTGTAGQKRVSTEYFACRQFPLPPTAEQVEIVNIVNRYVAMCNDLSEKLHKLTKLSEHLAIASISTLTGININHEEEPLKAPQNELVAPVTLGPNKPNSKDAAPLASVLARQNGEMNANDLWQRFGGEVDAFYAQLKTEVAHGWLAEPTEATMLEKEAS